MIQKALLEEMQALAKSLEGECVSSEYISKDIPLTWRCKHGHVFDLSATIVKQGGWCGACNSIKTTGNSFEKFKEKIEEKGFVCLTDKYENRYQLLDFKCENNHYFSITRFNLNNRKYICFQCKSEKELIEKFEIIEKIAIEKGGKVSIKNYKNDTTKMLFECKEGHQWHTVPTYIKSGGWCPECAGVKKWTIEGLSKIAIERGGKFLSKTYKNTRTKYLWECKEGHQFKTTPATVLNHKTWCPKCGGTQKHTIEEIREFAKNKGGECLSNHYKDNKQLLLFKCSEGHQFKTSYNSVQGGSWCPKCAGKAPHEYEDFKKMTEKLGLKLLSKTYKSGSSFYHFKCKNNHVFERKGKKILYQKTGCPLCAKNKKFNLEEIKQFAIDKGGKCLSNTYVNSLSKMKFSCSKGHVWETTFSIIKRGSWCPTCAGRPNYTIEDLKKIASENEGKFLSDKYLNSKTKYLWECKEGHQFQSTSNHIFNEKTWCKKCYHSDRTLTIEKINEFLKTKGGKCLSQEYKGREEIMLFECAKGHQFESRYSYIKKGTWCKICKENEKN